MTREDNEATRAVRRATLKSLKAKKKNRLQQLKTQYEHDIREVNINYANDPERLRAKYAADDYARSERAKKRAARRIEQAQRLIEKHNKARQFSLGEEIASAIVQGIGAALSIAAIAILLYHAATSASDNLRTIYIATFACSISLMVVMYVMSTLHHALTADIAKEVFNRLAHCFIFLILGSVYTLFTIVALDGIAGWVLFGIVWFMSLVGVVMYAIWGDELLIVNIILYLVGGWIGIALVHQLYRGLPSQSFVHLFASGGLYSVGCVFLLLRKVKYMHAVGNFITLAGTMYLFAALYFAVA
ncbi:MAG: hemolysin III family protein [Treponema sp.]|nr:hemolysin III family protein [Treponema sp.]